MFPSEIHHLQYLGNVVCGPNVDDLKNSFGTYSGYKLAERYIEAVGKGEIVLSQNSDSNWKLYVDRYCGMCGIVGYRLRLFRPWNLSDGEYEKMAQAVFEHSLLSLFPRKEFKCAMSLYNSIDEGALKKVLSSSEINVICVNVLIKRIQLSESFSKFLFSKTKLFKCVDEKNMYPLTAEGLLGEPKLIEHIFCYVQEGEEVAMAIRLAINLFHFCHDETKLMTIKDKFHHVHTRRALSKKVLYHMVEHSNCYTLSEFQMMCDFLIGDESGDRKWFEDVLLSTLGGLIHDDIITIKVYPDS